MRRMIDGLRHVLFWVVLIVSIFLIVLSFLPRVLGCSSDGIGDDSMQPLLHKGDWIWIRPIAFKDVQVGDLLTFEDPDTGKRFTRIAAEIWTQQQEIVTRAAESDTPDPYTIAYSCTVGKVEHIVRFIGYPSVWVQTLAGKIILSVIYLFWLAAEIEVYAAHKRRERADA